jgi:hypothetical protein
MVSCGVATAIGKKVCESLGESGIAQYIGVGGTSLTGVMAIGVVIQLIGKLKSL